MDTIEQMMQESGVAETPEDVKTDQKVDENGSGGEQGADAGASDGKEDGGKEEKPGGEPGASEDKPTTFDYTEHFSDFESIEQVKEAAVRGRSFTPETVTELETLRQSAKELETLKAENEKLRNQNPYENPNFYKLDRLAKENPDDVAVYQKYLFGNPSDVEVLKLDLMQKNPDIFKEDPTALQRQLERKYPDYFAERPDENDEEALAEWTQKRKDAEIDIKIDAKKSRADFEAKLGEIELPNVKVKTKEEIEAEDKAFVDSWKPTFSKIRQEFKAIPIPVSDSKDPQKTQTLMDYTIPEADLENLHTAAANHIINARLEPTPENAKVAMEVAKGMYLYENFPKIVAAVADKLFEDSGEKWRLRIHNPKADGPDDKGTKKTENVVTEGSSDDIFDKVTEGMR